MIISLFPEAIPGVNAPAAYAHNLDQRMNWIQFDSTTLATLDARIQGNSLPLMRVGDELGMIVKVTPTDGTTTGVGGYVTVYLPNGVQVIDAAYLSPDGAGDYVEVPMKGQAIEPLGYGPIGPASTPALVGLTLGPNIMGQTSPAVSPTGVHLGTMAGVYGDTGIFYSTDPDTAWNSWVNSAPALGATIKSNSGDSFVPFNKWDAEQMYAWGISSPASPIVDPNGRGSAPWGMASGVAGPQSGYAWAFDKDVWDASAKDAAAMRSSIKVGPWNRLQYPGSQIAYDEPGRTDNTLGFAGVDGSQIGWNLNTTPLPATVSQTDSTSPKAIRWSVGALIENRPEYVWFKVKLLDTSLYQSNCVSIYHADVFGGDAGGEDGGKDHLWRYYDPTTADLSSCVALAKQASRPVVGVNGVFTYDLEVVNTSANITLTSVQIKDTLPSGVTFLSASPTANSGPNPLIWNIPSLAPGQKFTARVTVRAKSTGLAINQLCVTAANLGEQCVDEGTYLGATPLLQQSKSVNTSNVAPGANVQYTLLIDNIGTGPSDSPIPITENLPNGFTFVSLDSVTANNANAILATTVNSANPNRPIFTVSRSIEANKSLELTFTAKVPNTATPGLTYCNSYSTSAGAVISTGTQACVTVGGAKIGDTIFRDWNGNGVQDPGEEGIAGVTVDLKNGGGATIATKVTDANGNYLFTGLSAGTYTVDVVAPANHALTTPPEPRLVTVATNENKLDVDFGYRPTGTASIGDLVFEDKGNDGTFSSGLGDVGIDGVTVNLYEDQNGNGIVDVATDTLITSTVTAGGGAYLFSNLATGYNYIVDAVDANVTTQLGTAAWLAVTPDPHKVTSLSGAYLTADFGYFKVVPGSIGDQVFIDTNSNNTYESGVDTPLANVTLVLYQDGGTVGTLGAGDTAIMTTTSSITGTYKFANLPAGNYIVDVIQTDPNVPANYAPSLTDPFPVVLGLSQVRTDVDFPFRYVAPPPSPLTKAVNKTNANPGDTLYYTLTTNYTGSSLLTSVTVTDAVPAGTTYVAASANAGGTESGGVVTWNLGSNAAGVPGTSTGGGTTLFTAIKDANVTSARPDNNFGGSTLLGVNSVYNSLVQFDLSSIPAGMPIANAQLVMERVGGTLSPTGSVDVMALTQDWDEGTQNDAACTNGVTWTNRDCNPVVAWTTAGGTYNASVFASIPVSIGTNRWDVTQLVDAWVQGKLTNNGLLLRVPSGSDTHNFSSKEGATPPKLLITYGAANGAALWTSASATPDNATWTPYLFGSTATTGVSTGSAYRIMQVAAAPTRAEKMAVGIINNVSNNVVAMRQSGNTWVSASINPLGTVAETSWWTADVAYEQTSGDAIMVWGNGTSLQYSEWNGTSWTAKTTISPTPLAGTIKTVRLASKPGSNEIVAAVATTAGHYALVWNGSSWGNGQILYNTAQTDFTDIYVAYEIGAGRAMVVYGKNSDANVYYQIWTGSSWITEASLTPPSGVTAASKWYVLASDPTSSRIALGVQSTSPDGWLSVWSGSAWQDTTRATLSGLLLDTDVAPNLGMAFEGVTGRALAVYGRSAQNVVFYRTWTNGSGWSSEVVGPTIGANTNSLTLDGHAQSDRIMLSVQDDANDLHYLLWNGTSWGADTVKSINTGETKNQPFAFVWDDAKAPIAMSLGASADTYIDEQDAGVSFGTITTMRTEPSPVGQRKFSLVQFNTGGIPAGAVIHSATLGLYVSTAGTNHVDPVHVMTTTWTEAGTWNDSDGAGAGDWASAGTVFGANDYNPVSLSSITPSSIGYNTVDVTSAVNGWVNSGVLNRGFLIASTGTDTGDVVYATRESASNKPYLSIVYSVKTGVSLAQSVSAASTLVTGGTRITITQILTAGQNIASVTPTLLITPTNGAGTTYVSGPTPASATVGTGGTTFTWVYTATAGTSVGQLTFGGNATGSSNTWPHAKSNSVIVAPALTFRTTVNTPATVNPVSNTGYIKSASVIPLTPSNTVQTNIGASIGDFVWADLNGDGTQNVGEPGLNGVQVCATPAAGGTTVCATSDALGIYHVYGLTNGVSYNVTLTPATVPAGYLPSTATTLTRTATTAGVTDADFGLRPPGAATIGDTVWIDSNEDGVVDSSETGLPGVTVKLYNSAGTLLLDTVRTDANGIYTFTGLYVGNYLVDVDTSSVVTTSFGVTGTLAGVMDLVSVAGSTASLTNPLVVNVPANNSVVTTADFGFNWSGKIGDLVWYDDNGDKSSVGEPGAEDVVLLLYYDTNGNGSFEPGTDTPYAFTESGVAGAYLFDNLPPGTYIVKAEEQTVESRSTPGLFATMVATTGTKKASTLSPATSMVNLTSDFGFIEAGELEGHVFHDVNSNGSLDGGEPRLPGVLVTLRDSAGNVVDTMLSTSSGEFKFFVAPGDYTVDYSPADGAIPAGLTQTTTPISYVATVRAGQELGNLDFGLDNAGVIGNFVFRDSNNNGVYDPNTGESGLEGITVLLYSGGSLMDIQATDAKGNYAFVGLAGATYTVTVDATSLPAGYVKTALGTVNTDNNNQAEPFTVVLSEGAVVNYADFGYRNDGTLTGQGVRTVGGFIWNDLNGDGVKDGGEPVISGVDVVVNCGADGTYATTSTSSTFGANWLTTVTVNEPATCTITVDTTDLPSTAYVQTGDPDVSSPPACSGAACDSQTTITVNGADVLGQDFGYQQQFSTITGTVCVDGGGVSGQCDLPGEAPIQGITITLVSAGPDGFFGTGDEFTQTVQTDASGNYTFTGLLANNYQVRETDGVGYISVADADGFNPNLIDVALAAGQTAADRDFVDAIVPGTIGDLVWYDTNGDGVKAGGEAGIPGVVISLTNSAGSSITTTTDAGGLYTFTNLLTGAYTVTVVSGTPTGASATSGAESKSSPYQLNLGVGATISNADFGYDLVPAYALDKTLITPSPARTRETVTFRITITNTGAGIIDFLPLADSWNSVLMRYTSASTAPDNGASDGTLNWSDLTATLGDIAPGGVISLTVSFEALRDTTGLPSGTAQNTATTSGATVDPDGAAGPLGSVESLPTLNDLAEVVILGPTDVAVVSVGVMPVLDGADSSVRVVWQTVSEVNVLAFNLYRRDSSGGMALLTDTPILAQNSGQAQGGLYTFEDGQAVQGEAYTYLLEILLDSGSIGTYELGAVTWPVRIFLPVVVR